MEMVGRAKSQTDTVLSRDAVVNILYNLEEHILDADNSADQAGKANEDVL